jgi:general secretion pathway protein A
MVFNETPCYWVAGIRVGIAMIALGQFRNESHRPPDASDPLTPGRVYMAYFQFKCPPFAITPDPEFLFLSETHRNAIEKIQYGIQSRQGFMLLTGEVGTGKSTLCRVMLDLMQADAQTVYIINPSLSGRELIATILDDLGVARSAEASKKTLIDQLNAYLLANARTRPVVIIIDDAQTMSSETLEDMRLLSNLETDKEKLLQVLLVGQPELLGQIEQPAMRQLRQRIAVNCRLDFLKIDEVGRYIERRLFIAGNHAQARFTPRLVKQIHKSSQGVPRLINKICDLALTAAYTADTCVVDVPHLTIAKEEIVDFMPVRGAPKPTAPGRAAAFGKPLVVVGSLVVALGLAAGGYLSLKGLPEGGGVASPSKPAALAVAGPVSPAPQPPVMPRGHTLPPSFSIEGIGRHVGTYILQLGSYTTLDTTLRAIDIYAGKAVDAYWAALPNDDDTVWYRVYAGRFADRKAARAYQQTHALEGAVIRHAPWTVAVGGAGSTEQIAALHELLRVYRLDGQPVPGAGDLWHLLSGAFLSRQGAETMAGQIHQRTGLATRIMALDGRRSTAEARPANSKGKRSS